MNIEGFILACVLALLAVGFARLARTHQNPITIIVLWWSVWLAVAAWSPLGIDTPSVATFALFSASIGAFLIGAVIQSMVRTRHFIREKEAVWSSRRVEVWLLIAASSLLLFLVALAVVARSNVSLDADLRGAALGATDGPDPVFGSSRYRSLFNAVVPGSLLLLVIFGKWRYLTSGRWPVLVVAAGCAFVYSLALYGRLWLQVLVVLSVASLMMSGRIDSRVVRARVRRGAAMTAMLGTVAVGMSWMVTQQRSGGNGKVADVVVSFVHYHTFGFTLIDYELSDSASWLLSEEQAAGLLTVNGLHDIVAILMRRFDPSYVNPGAEAVAYRQQFRTVGQWENRPVTYNAYYTFMFTVLADGGRVYAVLGPFCLGWWCMGNYRRYLATAAFRPFCYVMLSVWLGVFSLFQSAIESSAFWTAILAVNVIVLLASAFVRERGRERRRPLGSESAIIAGPAGRRPLVVHVEESRAGAESLLPQSAN